MATVNNRATGLDWVWRVVAKVTIPFAVGSGIRNIADMQELFSLGMSKVSINTARVKTLELVREALE